MPSFFRASTIWFMSTLFFAIASCAVEPRVLTPSCMTAMSGTARTSALAVTVIVGGSVVSAARAGVSGGQSRKATIGIQSVVCLMRRILHPPVSRAYGRFPSWGLRFGPILTSSALYRPAKAQKLLNPQDLLHLREGN